MPPSGFPQPSTRVFYGPAGEASLAVSGYTEADPVGVLGCLLAESAALLGRGWVSWCSGQRIECRLFVVLVGPTSNGRKGTAGGVAREIMSAVGDLPSGLYEHGFASGEALIENLAGRDDGRVLVEEPELASVLTAGNRDGSILSATLRTLWDGQRVAHRRAGSEMVAEDPHVCLIGHITPEELRAKLRGVDRSNGYANRLFPLAVHRRQRLTWFGPPGAASIVDQPEVAEHVAKLRVTLARAGGPVEVPFSKSGQDAWWAYYSGVGETMEVSARRDAHLLRVALLHAVLEGAPSINAEHLHAASALVDYVDKTWRWALGAELLSPAAARVLERLEEAGAAGIGRTVLHRSFSNHMTATELDAAVVELVDHSLAVEEQRPTGGRPERLLRASPSAG